ncbi:MAG: hypothetical protein EP319_17685 [Deltaproteobacteria bacterium]|nr:MAG: hypothetical protein EP319_17685 [Deltaproteobacteria bacterium]
MLNRAQLHFVLFVALLIGGTLFEINEDEIKLELPSLQRTVFLDREGEVLSRKYLGQWNHFPYSISDFPTVLIDALITSEDQRFNSHNGIDLRSKARAVWQNIKRGGIYQGGSTLSEQTVRIISTRKRTVWNRWIQMWQAWKLEKDFSKEEILSFYLNQVPFASHRRGFHQASELYFKRSLDTLSVKEILALVVLVKSPSRFDIRKGNQIEKSIMRLAGKLGLIEGIDDKLVLQSFPSNVQPSVDLYLDYLAKLVPSEADTVKTSIDRRIQLQAESLLSSKLKYLSKFGARNGALIVIDHRTSEVLSHVVVNDDENGLGYDTTLVPRQPGSTLKPFLYTLAFSKGYNTGSVISDTPVETTVAGGLHQITNYSHNYYGELTFREALANSLNVPAIKLVREVGEEKLYETLVKAGIPLEREVSFYGDGLALGNMEVSLMDMMKAWTCLARRGVCHNLRHFEEQYLEPESRLFTTESTDMTLDILSDPKARQKEFGRIEFDHQVGFKTGTSTDYRDSWAFVFNSKYLIGVWIGNLDGSSMDEITGSKGALKVGKTLIESRWLNTGAKFQMSPNLSRVQVCLETERGCDKREELSERDSVNVTLSAVENDEWKIQPDTDLLHLARDPRIPDHLEVMTFRTSGSGHENTIWKIDNKEVHNGSEFVFKLTQGEFVLEAISGQNKKRTKIYVH